MYNLDPTGNNLNFYYYNQSIPPTMELIQFLFSSINENKSLQEILTIIECHHLVDVKALVSQTDSLGFDPIYYAIEHGRLDLVEWLLNSGFEEEKINAKYGPQENSLLHIASGKGHDQIVAFLLEKGADKNIQNKNGITAVGTAACFGHVSCVELLLTEEDDINAKYGLQEETLLHLASGKGHEKIVAFLIEKGANKNIQNKMGLTAVGTAACFGHVSCVELLLTKEVDINAKYALQEQTLLHLASGKGHEKIVAFLIGKGANKNIQNKKGVTSVYGAALQGHVSCVKLLLTEEVDINAKYGLQEETLLHLASGKGHEKIVTFLLEKGANKNIQSKDGFTAICEAALQGHVSCIKLLLTEEDDINAKYGPQENSLLHYASRGGRAQIVAFLLKKGANKNIPDKAGFIAVRAAAYFGHISCVELLLTEEDDINAKYGLQEETLLHLASGKGHEKIVAFLLKKGANKNIPDKAGFIAVRAAAYFGHISCVELLLTEEDDINAKYGLQEETLLHLASGKGHEKIVAFLIEKGANKNIQNKMGLTAVGTAACFGHVSCVELLLTEEVDINAKYGRLECTLLHLAGMGEKAPMLLWLLTRGANWNILDAKQNSPFIYALTNKEEIFHECVLSYLTNQFFEKYPKISENDFSQYKSFDDFFTLYQIVKSICKKSDDLNNNTSYISFLQRSLRPLAASVISHSGLPTTLNLELKQFEETFEKVKGLDEKTIELFLFQLIELENFLKKKLIPFIQDNQASSTSSETISTSVINPHFFLRRCDTLIKECRLSIEKIQRTLNFDQKEEAFNSDDIFGLLISFGGGIAHMELKINPRESYLNLLGCEAQDFYSCGFNNGADLRAIGVDLSLKYLIETKQYTQEQLISLLKEKWILFKELQALYPDDSGIEQNLNLIDQLLTQLQENTEIDLILNDLSKLEFSLGQCLIKCFFLQGVTHIQQFFARYEEKSLETVKKSNSYTTIQLYTVLSSLKRKIEESDGAEANKRPRIDYAQ